MNNLWNNILWHVFLWTGSRIFPVVAVYNPTRQPGDPVRVVHFGLTELDIEKSCKDMIEDNDIYRIHQ
jgi:hypothetical protein